MCLTICCVPVLSCQECLIHSTNILWVYLNNRTSAGGTELFRYYSAAGGPQNFCLHLMFLKSFMVYNLKNTSDVSHLNLYMLIITMHKYIEKIFPVDQ